MARSKKTCCPHHVANPHDVVGSCGGDVKILVNRRFTLDDDVVTLAEFFRDNEGGLDDETRDAILRLDIGESYTGGGGAAAEWTIRRVS